MIEPATTIDLHIRPREDGGFEVVLWRGDKPNHFERHVDPTYHEAVDRGVAWLRDERGQR